MIKKMIRKIARARTFILLLAGLDNQTPWPSFPAPSTVEYLHVDGLKIVDREAEPISAAPKLASARISDNSAAREAALKQETELTHAEVVMVRINPIELASASASDRP